VEQQRARDAEEHRRRQQQGEEKPSLKKRPEEMSLLSYLLEASSEEVS
jgi:hypothetical protein